ncbi:helix-turn-helix domain-containing protein [Marispirochaeta aestuarii]|uniref:helix-turn-helix domain-containing protein n=1 Tax=Marispirochaeta aestuarii TaxID=1963862 RepID=UPI0029C90E83|nr:helix-turn-helix domain-containing protein [Marispirochaeta aestuarii]
MSEEMQEITNRSFKRVITRERRQRLISGNWESGDLAALRVYLRLTQKQFADCIGISINTLQNWEQDRRQPEGPAKALLRILAKHPRLILQDLEKTS